MTCHFVHVQQRPQHQNYNVPDLSCRFVHANSVISTWITSLYGFQTSPVVVCMKNSVICCRMTSLYGFQLSSVVLYIQNSDLRTKIACVYGAHNSPVILCLQNSVLAPELIVSMDPSPHLWLVDAKQRLFDPNNKSLRVPDITCTFVTAIQRD